MLRAKRRPPTSRYGGGVRAVPFLLVLLLACGCAGVAPKPSSPAERTPTPTTVTADNPGGDAENPIDAALERLLSEPMGTHLDRFRTLKVRLPDRKNWKRVRFFGYPTRVGYRYGADHYAMVAVTYSKTDDDSPAKCIETFNNKALRTADTFDLHVGEIERSMSQHYKGNESVDWAERERQLAERRRKHAERIAAYKRDAPARRKRILAARKQIAERRKQWLAAAKKRKEAAEKKARQDAAAGEPAAAGKTPPKDATQPEQSGSDAKTGDAKASEAKTSDAKTGDAKTSDAKASDAKPAPVIGEPVMIDPKVQPSRRFFRFTPQQLRKAQQTRAARLKAAAEKKAAKRGKRGKQDEAASKKERPYPNPYGFADMPVARTSGEFRTLFNRDRYLAAVVAYQSWPGTCLVQAFSIRVGSDEALARRVVDHWLKEYAPKLAWSVKLRAAPKIQNR